MKLNTKPFNWTSVAKVLADVLDERQLQHAKWGEQNQPPPLWLAILGEEYGEVCKAVHDHYLLGTGEEAEYRHELIHVAAVAVQAVEAYDRMQQSARMGD